MKENRPLRYRPVVLAILDGFGIGPQAEGNAIWRAKTPFFDSLPKKYPTYILEAAGLSVGLPFGEVGNSEVGHYNIGSGQLLYQSLPRINNSIEDKSFFSHPILQKAVQYIKQSGKKLHLAGLIGTGGVHAHQNHLNALLELCKNSGLTREHVCLHLFLDGRDSAKNAAHGFIESIVSQWGDVAQVATVTGRGYAMDRNQNWDKTKKTYEAMTRGVSNITCTNPIEYVLDSYTKGIYDEDIEPTVVLDSTGNSCGIVGTGDVLLFFNFRADRARQITQAFVEKDFKGFERKERIKDIIVITFTEYKKGLPAHILYPPQIVKNSLAKIISDYGYRQLHIAETEKYAHVTFFLNGLVEEPFPGEERMIIPSPAVDTYDLAPEMSAYKITDTIIEKVREKSFDFIIANYANGDMVGHTGNIDASIKAVEVLDDCISRLCQEVLMQGGIIFITADHGNVEEVENVQTFDIDKEHSIYPVPFYIVASDLKGHINQRLIDEDLSHYAPEGVLADVAPTILKLVGLEPVKEMIQGLDIQ